MYTIAANWKRYFKASMRIASITHAQSCEKSAMPRSEDIEL